MMARALKVFLAIAAALVVFVIGLPSALSYYDAHTQNALLRVASQELTPRASKAEMTDFMRRHTIRFDLDERYHDHYRGIALQTWLDRFLFNRKIQILLKLNEDGTFRNAEINVFYTFL